jgi:uncharacterized protein (DUF302 family)
VPEQNQPTPIVTKVSVRSVAETVTRFRELLSKKGIEVFAVIDQSEAARQVGLELRETVLVIFGDPRAGTPVMQAAPLAGVDLPLKVMCWSDGRQTNVSYEAPQSLAARHQLTADLAARLAGIDGLTDALVAPG